MRKTLLISLLGLKRVLVSLSKLIKFSVFPYQKKEKEKENKKKEGLMETSMLELSKIQK